MWLDWPANSIHFCTFCAFVLPLKLPFYWDFYWNKLENLVQLWPCPYIHRDALRENPNRSVAINVYFCENYRLFLVWWLFSHIHQTKSSIICQKATKITSNRLGLRSEKTFGMLCNDWLYFIRYKLHLDVMKIISCIWSLLEFVVVINICCFYLKSLVKDEKPFQLL